MLILLRRKLDRLRNLTPEQRWILLESMALLPFVSLGLRALGFARMHKALAFRTLNTPTHSTTMRDIEALSEALSLAAGQCPFPVSCLTRSLLLSWLLTRRQVANQLRIGVRMDGDVLQAHAWVECEGVPVNDSRDVATRFAAFDETVHEGAFRAP
jgi:hypothetical protein